MTITRLVATLAVSAALLAGCSAIAPDVVPTPAFVLPDYEISDWQESTVEEFVEAFPDLNTSFVSDIEQINVQRNGTNLWMIGSGGTGFSVLDDWARESYEIAYDNGEREALIETDDKLILFTYRAAADGFLAYFFISD